MKNTDFVIIEKVFSVMGTPIISGLAANTKAETFYYRNNTDGTVRWVWPQALKQPLFLKFYNAQSFRAKCIEVLIRLLFVFGLQKLFASGKIKLTLSATQNNSYGSNWALFTGTNGLNRTALIYSKQKDSFYKIAVGTNATIQLVKEYTALKEIEKLSLHTIEQYSSKLHSKELLEVNNIGGNKRSGALTGMHWNMLLELAKTCNKKTQINQLKQWQQSLTYIQLLKFSPNNVVPQGLVRNLEKLSHSIKDDTEITTSLAHNDFTPWNIFVKKDKLAVIDWEMFDRATPALFDAFHFNYQQGTLVESLNHKQLSGKIEASLNNDIAKSIINDNGIDIELHHKLYLLFTVSYYLHIYSLQEKQQAEIHKSVAMWNNAVNAALAANSNNQRPVLINAVFDFFQPKNYAALKWVIDKPERLTEESDIDLCIEKRDLAAFKKYIENNSLVAKVVEHRLSFMSNFSIILKDNSFLSIDLIWKIKRKDMVMLKAKDLIASAKYNRFGVKTPAKEHEFTYTWLFYLLNGASMPDKYINHYHALNSADKDSIIKKLVWTKHLGVNRIIELFEYTKYNHNATLHILSRSKENTGLHKLVNKIEYLIDKLRELNHRKGFIITFSGVDGAGKSTIIEHVKHNLVKKYRQKVVVLRHRPSVLPMLNAWKVGTVAAEQKAASTLPRMGKNKSTASSLLRFGYYYLDYLLGQFVVNWKYVYRGYIVVYDRYYFDFINDSKRSNIVLPASITKAGYLLLQKPRFNFFLHADHNIILARKKELDGNTIQELTNKYLILFDELKKRSVGSSYVSIENNSIKDTLATITNHVTPAIL